MEVSVFKSVVRIALSGMAVAGALYLGTSGLLGSNAVQAAGCDVSAMTLSSQEQAFVAAVNRASTLQGGSPVITSGPLNVSATWEANDMVATGITGIDTLSRTFVVKMQECGIFAGADSADSPAGAGMDSTFSMEAAASVPGGFGSGGSVAAGSVEVAASQAHGGPGCCAHAANGGATPHGGSTNHNGHNDN
jgi:hypothetical protein